MDFREFCSRLLDNTDIVKLISGYVPLKRAGNSYKACCPFHNERTPSFSVDPSKQLYHCFGCGKGGNAITFLRDIENIETIDAVRMLADAAHMELPAFSGDRHSGISKDKRLRLYGLMREAARHYNANLSLPGAQVARDYIGKRKLPPNIVTAFRAGLFAGLYGSPDLSEKQGLHRSGDEGSGTCGSVRREVVRCVSRQTDLPDK